ncbi:TPA: hypothetical protein JG829_002421 [Enterobacter hormaechei subsp. steigerwaltii]|uniref:hypothetical protein n=1 Tax=Enterobacter hormaechei TaxID=158836 RepID=UPI002570E528|nr:hypothetical protein [Enterobacter hormaechei]MCM8117119.1 hypothetical protein [Enterobacter hormaechei]MDL4434904.1 hypothetical protein [Enterobacter hormaechei]HAV1619717.1 hypothetical protein [Enterobacter hormaechei subsp. steigerwaltii]
MMINAVLMSIVAGFVITNGSLALMSFVLWSNEFKSIGINKVIRMNVIFMALSGLLGYALMTM